MLLCNMFIFFFYFCLRNYILALAKFYLYFLTHFNFNVNIELIYFYFHFHNDSEIGIYTQNLLLNILCILLYFYGLLRLKAGDSQAQTRKLLKLYSINFGTQYKLNWKT